MCFAEKGNRRNRQHFVNTIMCVGFNLPVLDIDSSESRLLQAAGDVFAGLDEALPASIHLSLRD